MAINAKKYVMKNASLVNRLAEKIDLVDIKINAQNYAVSHAHLAKH